MKKIVYIITLPDWGGAQKYVFQEALKEGRENIVIVIAGQSDTFKSKINLLNEINYYNENYNQRKNSLLGSLIDNYPDIKIHTGQLKNLVRPIHPIKDFLALMEIVNFYNKEKPNTIHLNSSKTGILGSFARIFSKHKLEVIYTVHGWVFLEPMNPFKKHLYILLERLASRWRDKIIVLGEIEKQIALKYKICPEKKLEVLSHRMPTKLFLDKNFAKKELNLPQDKKIIGTVANFYPAKGLQYLIETASKINNPDVIFAVIGDGAERKKYELLITSYKLQDKFLLLGEKENAAQYLKAFDLFILPSIKEGAPYVILEAMAAELPIIATDVGNVSEMLKDYQNKTIIPQADIEALVKAIVSSKL